MKRLFVCALLLAAVECASHAATAGADLAANEKPDDVGDSQNPNPTVPQWRYGYRTTVAGTALTLFTASEHTDSYFSNEPMEGFYVHNANAVPAILVNTAPTNFTFNYGAGPLAPAEMMLHGDVGKWAVVRYTVPGAGIYNVTASFRPIQRGTVDVHVVSNGVSLFDQVLTNTQSAAPSFSNVVLAAGAVLDFVVGVNGQLNLDSTAFNATITTNATVATNTNTVTVLLTADPDFGAQTLDAGLGAPWNWASSGQHLVTASGQSPFTNLFANNGKGVSLPATNGNPYFVQDGFYVAAGATGYVSLVFDFRNTTADLDGWTVFLTTNADARVATVGFYITGNGFYALSSGGWSASLFSPVVGEWYHAQVLLDLTANSYSVSLQAFSSGAVTALAPRAFYTENGINTLYSDGASDGSGGIAPGHNLDNVAVFTCEPAPPRAADAGPDLAANEKPDGAGDSQNPNRTFSEWSYGYRSSVASAALTLFTAPDHTDSFISANEPMEGFHTHGGASVPAVLVNTGLTNFTCSFGAGPVAPHELMMHGDLSKWAVVRYTVPAPGSYDVTGSFRSIDAGDVDAHVVINGTAAFDQALLPGQMTDVALPNQVLQVGDVVDFVVGVNGTLLADSTAVSASIVPVSKAPASFQALAMPGGATTLVLAFSKPVTAQAAGFLLSGGANVLSVATGLASNVLVLTTTPLTQGTSYTLTMKGVTDLSGNPVAFGQTTNFVALDYTPADLALVRPPAEPPGPATRRGGLTISEIHYHPALRSDGRILEFVEIFNSLPWTEDLTGYRITGQVSYDFPAGTTIPSQGYLVVAAVPEDLQAVYGVSALGPYAGRLSNGGGTLRLRNEGNGVCFEVTFASDGAWPPAPDGGGPSLVLARPSLGMGDAAAWDMSAQVGGSPGAAEPALDNPWRAVLFNEVLAHSAGTDFIELYNYSTAAVDLSGCILTDNPDLSKYIFPPGTSIAAKGFVALTEVQLGFAPHAAGDVLYLKSPDGTRVLDAIRFEAQENGVSSGRAPDGAGAWRPLESASPGGPNADARRGEVVLSEIMYHPITESADDEYVELHNRSASAVDLSGWHLRGEADFDLPAGTLLAADGRLVVAKNPAHLIPAYAGLSGSNTLGPFSGSLSHRGGRLVLRQPVPLCAAGPARPDALRRSGRAGLRDRRALGPLERRGRQQPGIGRPTRGWAVGSSVG